MDTGDFCGQPATDRLPLTTSRDSFDYNMSQKDRGLCLILATENFSRKSPATRNIHKRTGSSVDTDRLCQLFGQQLGFSMVVHKDLRVNATQSILKQVAAYDHSDSDCFVCIVLTHGDHGELYAYDGKYTIDLLFKNFIAHHCPSLVGKPKLFFIQACQGARTDDGVAIYSRDDVDSVSYFKIPSYADFMIAYSSVPGFYSFRNTNQGAWFIHALVEVFREFHLQYDLLTMMTIVCHRVAYRYESNAANPELSGKKQIPCITSMLTRRVFLFPKSIQL